MKKIEAIIREEKMDAVKTALEKSGYYGMTVSEVSGVGRQGGLVLQWRVGEYKVDLLPKIKIEVIVDDNAAEKTVEAILRTAKAGQVRQAAVVRR